MPLPQYAAARDANEPDIVEALETVGASVQRLSDRGVPDLLVCFRGALFLLEVIGDAKAKKYRKTGGLTPDQVAWHERWPGRVALVRTTDEALQAVGLHISV